MQEVYAGRYTAVTDEPFVVFLIGMRINKLHLIHKWLPVARSMGPMLQTLYEHPQKGFLAGHGYFDFGHRVSLLVQYWRSFADLEAFARNREDPHLAAWQNFNRAVGTDGTVGIWHETYKIHAHEHESVYGNMPRFGLATAFDHVPVGRHSNSARQRINKAKNLEKFTA